MLKERRASPSDSNIDDGVTDQGVLDVPLPQHPLLLQHTPDCSEMTCFTFVSSISLWAFHRKGTLFVLNWFITEPSK